jgi:hypothetical protein
LVDAARKYYPDLFEKAAQHWKKNSTLQSLAIGICLSENSLTHESLALKYPHQFSA